MSLWAEGILPDAREGNIARWYAWDGEECRTEQTNVTVNLELFPAEGGAASYDYRAYSPRDHFDITVLTRSAHTLGWLKDTLGLEPTPGLW